MAILKLLVTAIVFSFGFGLTHFRLPILSSWEVNSYRSIDSIQNWIRGADVHQRVLRDVVRFMTLKPAVPAGFAKDEDLESMDPNDRKIENLVSRRLRIERLLVSLGSVAEVVLRMNPSYIERIEPVLIDLTKSALELSVDQALVDDRTDDELDRLENELEQLARALGRTVEPEFSL